MTTSSLKTWMPLLVVAATLVASIVMNFVQKANTDAQLEFLVKNMNEQVLPSIQSTIEDLETTVAELKEDNAFWKGFFQIGKYVKGKKVKTEEVATVEEEMQDKGGVTVDMGVAKFHYVRPEKMQKRSAIKLLRTNPAQADVGGM